MKFVGSFQMKIDNKNRVRLPAKFRNKLPEGFYLNFGTKSITILSPEDGEKKVEDLMEEAETVQELRAAKKYASMMYEIERGDQDEQGRFVLPAKFIKYAKLQKDVWFVGEFDSISLMSDEEYQSRYAEEDFEDLELEVMKLELRKKKRAKAQKAEK